MSRLHTRMEARADLLACLRKIRKERTATKFQKMQAMLTEARETVLKTEYSRISYVPNSVEPVPGGRGKAKTVFKMGSKDEALSHGVRHLDSGSALQAKVPHHTSRTLINSTFRAADTAEFEFVPILMDPEANDVHPTGDDDIAEYYALLDVDGRESEIHKGPIYDREEYELELKLLLEHCQMSSHKALGKDDLVDIIHDIFERKDKEERPSTEAQVMELLGLSGTASTDDSMDESVVMEREDTSKMPQTTGQQPISPLGTSFTTVTVTEKSDSDGLQAEIIHETLEGNDPDYLKVIDTPRRLYCPQCKLYDCNLHKGPTEIYFRGSLQLQYETAIETERRRPNRPPLKESLQPEPPVFAQTELTAFQKSICRRVFLIYEGDLQKVAIVVNAPVHLVEKFCRGFEVPSKRILLTEKPPETGSRYYNVKNYEHKWYIENNQKGLRISFSPCVHEGPCNEESCKCIQNKVFCINACCRGVFSRNFFRGCNCKGPCQKGCTCFMNHRECDPNLCKCDTCSDPPGRPTHKQVCQNDNITMRRRYPTYVARSEIPDAGFGLYCRETIPRGKFIGEYVGEMISEEETEQRGRLSDMVRNSSVFELYRDFSLDASNKCNEMRFVNHSINSNVRPARIVVNGDCRLGFFAQQDIPAQTELTFQYGWLNRALDSNGSSTENRKEGSKKRKGAPNAPRQGSKSRKLKRPPGQS